MKLVLPKPSRGLLFDRLLPIEMNEFDVDRLLPSLFYLVVTNGSQRKDRVNPATELDRYVSALAGHPRMRGFDTEEGRRLLDRWLRASVIRVSRVGSIRGSEQIEHVLPLTLLAYKTGLPAETSRQRRVHTFLYKILIDALGDSATGPPAAAQLRALFKVAFGGGVEIDSGPAFDGRYDGKKELDLHVLLTVLYLDGFQPTPARMKDALDRRSTALPAAALDLAEDLLGYLKAWAGRVPSLALTNGLAALIGVGLFSYTRRLAYAANALVQTGRMGATAPPMYVDFTRQRGSASEEMARAAVERDLEEVGVFYENAVLLRTLERFASTRPELRDRLDSLDTPQYLEFLVGLVDHARIEARAEVEIESIQQETLEACETDADREDATGLFRAMEVRYPEPVRRAAKLLALAQEQRGVQKHMQWYWSIAGLRKPYGILAGTVRGRRNWRYAMSDDLLSTLVQVAMLEQGGPNAPGVIRPRIRLSEFLEFLERRYGILVNRPPDFLDTAATRSGATANVAALRARLRQMGYFEALSDDFSAQYLRIPQAEVRE